ncbi:Uncharacterised protein [Mycobacteroides abscessus subsp. abscessus]|nr:Uncharacterised protein [Mycobacteroides abscessus subsp. abscessus]
MRAPTQRATDRTDDRGLQHDDRHHGQRLARDDSPYRQGGGTQTFQGAVAAVEPDGNGLSGEGSGDDGQRHDGGHEDSGARAGELPQRQQRQSDQEGDRDEHGQQQLLTITQKQLEFQPELREKHGVDGARPWIGGEGARIEAGCGGVGHRNSLPVKSRKTSSRLRFSTRRSVVKTSIRAHHAVTVASTCGSTTPSTRYSPGVTSVAL